MLQVIRVAQAMIALLPLVIDFVKAVEAAFPQSGQGESKLALVRQMLEGAFAAGQDLGVTFTDLWPKLQGVIGSVVAIFNSIGEFRKQ